jgi:hypothetical protein
MKKIAIAILAFAYISTSTGIVLHTHYCMGEPVAWGLGQNEYKTCPKCGMAKSNGKDGSCCKDEYKVIKNNTDQKSAENVFHLVQLPGTFLPTAFIEISIKSLLSVTEKKLISHHTPPILCSAVYIRNCVFLI